MNNLINCQSMTLKEITDLLNVRHDNAMRIVEKMLKDQAFGATPQIEVLINTGNGAKKTIKTYQLDKRQSIAVASRLNTALLMRVIDRWQELEAKPEPKTTLQMLADGFAKMAELEQEQAKQNDDIKRLQATVSTIEECVNEFTILAFANYNDCDINLQQANQLGRKASKLCRNNGYPIGIQKDPRFGKVNSYPDHVLIEVFKKAGFIPE